MNWWAGQVTWRLKFNDDFSPDPADLSREPYKYTNPITHPGSVSPCLEYQTFFYFIFYVEIFDAETIHTFTISSASSLELATTMVAPDQP